MAIDISTKLYEYGSVYLRQEHTYIITVVAGDPEKYMFILSITMSPLLSILMMRNLHLFYST